MKEGYFENEFAEMWIEDGIVYQVYKKNLVITLTIAKKLVEDRLVLSHGVTRPIFIDIRNLVSIDRISMKYYKTREVFVHINAAAFHIDNYFSKFIADIFLNFAKPLIPTKMFTDKKKALKWLENYKIAVSEF